MKKGKTFYSLLAFLTVCILLCILFFSGFYVSAAGTVNLADQYNIQDALVRSDFPTISDNGFVFDDSASEVTDFNNMLSNDLLTIPDDNNSYNYAASNYFLWGGDNDKVYFIPCSASSFVVVQDYQWGFDFYFDVSGYPNDGAYIDITTAYFDFTGFQSFTGMSFAVNNLVTVDGVDYGVYSVRGAGYNNIMCTDLNIIPGTLGVVPSSIDSDDNINPDYNSGGSDQGETAINNLFLLDGYFNWATPVKGYYEYYKGDGSLNAYTDNWFKGSISWNYQLTPYQLEHPSEFTMRFTYWVTYNVSQRVKTGFSDNYKQFGYSDNYGGNSFDVPFTDLYQSTTYNFQISTLMNDFKTWYFNLVDQPHFFQIDPEHSSFTLKIKAEVVSGSSSGSDYTDTLNFITNHVTNNSNGITNNNYPYTDNNSGTELATPSEAGYTNQTGYGNVPTTTGNNGSSTSGNNIVINNNNNRLIDPKPVVDYTKNELLPNEQDTNYVGTLENFLHADPFITLMSSTFTFVPVSVWSSLSTYVTIMLSMLVAFFALRLILDIL